MLNMYNFTHMIKKIFIITFILSGYLVHAQNKMTPEFLWQLGRVSGLGISRDNKQVIYSVSVPDVRENISNRKVFAIALQGGDPVVLEGFKNVLTDKSISPDGKYQIKVKEIKIDKIYGTDFYPELTLSNAQIYNSLNFRHWDTWEDGMYSHLFVHPLINEKLGDGVDIMKDEPFDSPQKPFGGDEDYTWRPDSKRLVYVSKKKTGTQYASSTNTDLYEYDVTTGVTKNITEGMLGYDTEPAFSSSGALAWLSMKRDGYEADKNDIIVRNGDIVLNLTQQWDGTVNHFRWSLDGKKIFFVAPVDGTIQLFEVDYPGFTKKSPVVKQITKGDFDVSGMVGQSGNTMVVSRTDMNHASELYTVNLSNGQMTQLTHVNDEVYKTVSASKIEKRMVTTTDGKQMLVWVIYPPDFDPEKKYPTLLYCQGGPQSALTQFYSYRWNFQLMAANGYIIVAPNRRGMPGHGVGWNEQISKDHGGQVMNDYLSAIDDVAKESYVDKNRLGCVGASYGGYSAFYLAGIHNNRFKTFIAHDGIYIPKACLEAQRKSFL